MNKKLPIQFAVGLIISIIIVVIAMFYFAGRDIDKKVLYCEDMNISDEQIDVAVEKAIVGLKNPWGNIEEWQIMSERVEKELGCVIEKDLDASPIEQKAIVEAENWQAYQNKEYRFEFKYPQEFIKQETDKGLYVKKEELGSDISIAVSVEKDYYQFDTLGERMNAEEITIEGKKGFKYFYQEGIGYSGVFILKLDNGFLNISYDHIGNKGQETVEDNFGKIISTLKFTK